MTGSGPAINPRSVRRGEILWVNFDPTQGDNPEDETGHCRHRQSAQPGAAHSRGRTLSTGP